MIPNNQSLIITILALSFSIISCLCSIINIILIKLLGQWNLFLAILYSMACCEALYAITFYFDQCVNHSIALNSFASFSQIFGGLSVTLWSNVLCIIVCFIVYYHQSCKLLNHFLLVSIIIYSISLSDAIVMIVSYIYNSNHNYFLSNQIYYYIRAASIVFNFIIFGCIYFRIKAMLSSTQNPTLAEMSIYVLSQRMMYYPIIQFISRVFNAIYEQVYNYDKFTDNVSETQFIWRCIVCITQPSAGIGFLIVFLIFQPRAQEVLWSILTCNYKSIESNNNINNTNNNNQLDTNNIKVPLKNSFTAQEFRSTMRSTLNGAQLSETNYSITENKRIDNQNLDDSYLNFSSMEDDQLYDIIDQIRDSMALSENL